MKNKTILTIIFCICLFAGRVGAEQKTAMAVAVLPLEVFSSTVAAAEGISMTQMLIKRLSLNPVISLPSLPVVEEVIKNAQREKVLDSSRLQEIARLLQVDILISGSVTHIGDMISIDVELADVYRKQQDVKLFVEGTQSEKLIAELSDKIEQMVLADVFAQPAASTSLTSGTVSPVTGGSTAKAPGGIEKYEYELDQILGIDTSGLAQPQKVKPSCPTPVEPSGLDQQDSITTEQLQTDSYGIESGVALSDTTAVKPRRTSDQARSGKGGSKIIDSTAFKGPFNINANSMEYDNRNNRIAFTGNVVARQSEFVIFSDKMNAVYDESNELQKLSATGNVKAVQGDRIATGKKVVYDNAQKQIIITGSPRVWQGDNMIQGNKIIVFLDQDRYVVQGSSRQRVSATIAPRSKKRKKNLSSKQENN